MYSEGNEEKGRDRAAAGRKAAAALFTKSFEWRALDAFLSISLEFWRGCGKEAKQAIAIATGRIRKLITQR